MFSSLPELVVDISILLSLGSRCGQSLVTGWQAACSAKPSTGTVMGRSIECGRFRLVRRDDGYFDEPIASSYDDDSSEMFDPAVLEPVVDFLAEIAGSGRALELGIGTGRIALPLAQRGVQVHGIDLSRAMVARLRAKPGGDDIGVTIGDFATTSVDGSFSLAYLVFNTIGNLTTQEAQVACFRNVAAHLQPGGCFVIEVGVPELQRLPPGETVRAFHVSETRWGFDEYDVATQGLTSHHLWIGDGKGRPLLVALPIRAALRARPDGATCRDEAARALGRLEEGAVHEREREARLGLGEGGGLGC